MFNNLQERLQGTFKKLTGKGVITEENVTASIKEVKMALLEADVNYRVVNIFLKGLKKKAMGTHVMKALNPGQQFIKIVRDELISMMGEENQSLLQKNNSMTIVMMVGLQGSGKTTTAAKLSARIKTWGRMPYLVPADVYRPAAIEQLTSLSKKINVPCFQSTPSMTPIEIARKAKLKAESLNANFMIIDTAGRLQIDQTLMEELENIKKAVQVDEILFVADAMTGQEAVNVAKSFNDQLDITGFILTKMDGDARGGAALSIRAITGKPVKFVGMGERVDQLEPFYPDRIASKILGMGDMLTFIEKAEQEFGKEDGKAMENRLAKGEFTLEDFQEQLRKIRKIGSLKELIKMLPGTMQVPESANLDDSTLIRINAIISSMTTLEKRDHTLLNGSRKIRIAKGSGTQVSDINRMLKQFIQMKTVAKKISGKKKQSLHDLQQMMGSGTKQKWK